MRSLPSRFAQLPGRRCGRYKRAEAAGGQRRVGLRTSAAAARKTLHYPLNNAEFFPPRTGFEPRRLQARNTLHYPLNNASAGVQNLPPEQVLNPGA